VGFEEFLDEELAALRRYATALTGDPQRAHDVV
jgi:DNA-directed RNA polymerase specialized sigma24 family protein